jgi:hypothetical protein
MNLLWFLSSLHPSKVPSWVYSHLGRSARGFPKLQEPQTSGQAKGGQCQEGE